MKLENQRKLFTVPPDVTYLNCAYMAPSLNSVRQAGLDAVERSGRRWELTMDDWFGTAETLRSLFAKIIHADAEQVALIPSVSYGIAIAAKNVRLSKGEKIVVIDQQYPSNIYAWRERAYAIGAEIVTVNRAGNETWTEALLKSIDERTGVVALPNCHWTDGGLIDLERISTATHKVKARLVLDVSQSLGAWPLDVQKIKPDFLVTVGYKWLMGPYGLGYLYAADPYCREGQPIEYSWITKEDAEDFTGLVNYRDVYRPGARRFDFGEFSGFIHLPMAIAALKQISAWGVENIAETLSDLTGQIENRARDAGFETLKKEDRVAHMTGIRLPDEKASALKKSLPEQKIYVSFRGSSMRVSPHVYNSADDIDKLFAAMG